MLKNLLNVTQKRGVYLSETVVELTKIFIKTQPTTLVVELMNKIRKSHFVIKATTGYWYVFRLSVRIASFLVWWLSMILRTYLQNFSPRN